MPDINAPQDPAQPAAQPPAQDESADFATRVEQESARLTDLAQTHGQATGTAMFVTGLTREELDSFGGA